MVWESEARRNPWFVVPVPLLEGAGQREGPILAQSSAKEQQLAWCPSCLEPGPVGL